MGFHKTSFVETLVSLQFTYYQFYIFLLNISLDLLKCCDKLYRTPACHIDDGGGGERRILSDVQSNHSKPTRDFITKSRLIFRLMTWQKSEPCPEKSFQSLSGVIIQHVRS